MTIFDEKMDRRDLLKMIAMATGSVVIGAEIFLEGTKHALSSTLKKFTPQDINILNEMGEMIIPTTPDSKGAKAAQVGKFMQEIVSDCYTPKDQLIFLKGLKKLHDSPFLLLNKKQKEEFMLAIGTRALAADKKNKNDKHYFTMIKQLTILGYFTSEIGCKQALRYLPIPGKYDGAYPYKKGDHAFSGN